MLWRQFRLRTIASASINAPFILELTEKERDRLLQCDEAYIKNLLQQKIQAGELRFDGELLVRSNRHPEPGQWKIQEDIEVVIHS